MTNVIFSKSLPQAFAKVGMSYPEISLLAGKISRFSTNGKISDSAGWCKLFLDGAGAVFGCHREGTSYIWQMHDEYSESPAPAIRKEEILQAEQIRKQAIIEMEALYAAAAKTATTIWEKASNLKSEHAYVTRKGIIPYGARQDRSESIVLPVYGADSELQSIQTIHADGSKRFLHRGKMKGGRLFIGSPINGKPLVLAEGWATGCSIHEATGEVVIICFSGGNLDDIAADIHRQFPDSLLLIAGDLDAHGKGKAYAQAAAAVAGGRAITLLPAFEDERDSGDFNDLHRDYGLRVVRSQLSANLSQVLCVPTPFSRPQLHNCDARDGTATTRPLSELGNALRMLDQVGERIKYVFETKSWIIWNGISWKWDDSSGIRTIAAKLPTQIYAEGCEYISDAEYYAKWARKSQEKRTVDASVALLSDFHEIRLPLGKIDADHFKIGFNSSAQTINLQDGTIHTAQPSDYITKSLGADSIGDTSKALRWLQFLDQVFDGDIELIDWIQRFCGYLLTGSTQEQIFLFCFGHGANGKSVFIEILKYILGDYSRAIASETLSESKRQAGSASPDLAALIGARLVICSETEDNTALAESLVKSLVSGDSISVRKLYAAPVQLNPNFKLIMAGNHKPIVRGNDNGIWRRIRLVPFNKTFSPEERDPQLLSKLKTEMPHILAWMIQGCINWQRIGLSATPATIRQATNAYQVDQDLTGAWLSECTITNPCSETSTTDLYANYKLWCLDNGLRPASAVSLGRRLSERGYHVRKTHGKRLWCGLSLADSRHECNSSTYMNRKGGY